MIVELKLSIPDDKYDDANYCVSQLLKMAKPGYPGTISIRLVGLQGAIKPRTKSVKLPARPQSGKLFN